MESEYVYYKLDEILPKFNNGEERFRTSPMFNKSIHTLVRGGDPLVLIDQLIEINDNLQKEFEQYIKSH